MLMLQLGKPGEATASLRQRCLSITSPITSLRRRSAQSADLRDPRMSKTIGVSTPPPPPHRPSGSLVAECHHRYPLHTPPPLPPTTSAPDAETPSGSRQAGGLPLIAPPTTQCMPWFKGNESDRGKLSILKSLTKHNFFKTIN